jgi:UDP-N-acetylmuramate dehydrogenase
MTLAETFPTITQPMADLAPYTHLRLGGTAEHLVEPRTTDELREVLQFCTQQKIPLRMLGGGFNLLIRDVRIPGAVLRLTGPAFESLEVHGTTIRAAGGASVVELIQQAVEANLSGLETLIGIRGTVGGSVRCNVGDRTGEIGSTVRRVAVLTEAGTEQIRTREELNFGDRRSDLDEPVILWVEFELRPADSLAILKRLKRSWVTRKAREPLSFQAAVRLFRNPIGGTAESWIEKAGLAKSRVGNAELSDRNANYVVAHPGTVPADIVKLMEHVRQGVESATGVVLEQELNVW